jgi:hypothetical protein
MYPVFDFLQFFSFQDSIVQICKSDDLFLLILMISKTLFIKKDLVDFFGDLLLICGITGKTIFYLMILSFLLSPKS